MTLLEFVMKASVKMYLILLSLINISDDNSSFSQRINTKLCPFQGHMVVLASFSPSFWFVGPAALLAFTGLEGYFPL